MKFKFCGNLDCPEWLIAEIIFLTKISTIKLRIICNNLTNAIIANKKDFKDVKKSIEEMNFNDEECNIIISVIEFIIKNAAKFDIDEGILNQELQQLGLPQENADSITKVFRNHRENLKNFFKKDIFGFQSIEDIDFKISYVLANENYNFGVKATQADELTDDILKENFKVENLEARINLCLKSNDTNDYHYTVSKEVLGKLINDLEKSYQHIKKFKE
jgi:hypothetical protein